jgi:hypothetical protein
MLSVTCNDSKLLAMLAHSVELVGKSGLELLTGDVGELSLGDERLSLSTHEFLLKHNNPGRVGLLVLQLGDLVGDLLLACIWVSTGGSEGCSKLTITAGLNRSLNVADALNRHAVLVVAVDILVLQFTNLVDQDTELICDVRNVVVTSLAPDGKLLL